MLIFSVLSIVCIRLKYCSPGGHEMLVDGQDETLVAFPTQIPPFVSAVFFLLSRTMIPPDSLPQDMEQLPHSLQSCQVQLTMLCLIKIRILKKAFQNVYYDYSSF